MSSFDVPQSVSNVLAVALAQGVITIADIVAMSVNHNNDWASMVNEIVDAAHTWIHLDRSVHESVVKAAEAYWATK